MNNIKETLKKLKEDKELAEQREEDAKKGTKEAEAKLRILQGEKTTLLSRINVVRAEVKKILARVEDRNVKLDHAKDRAKESEERRNELAKNEVIDYQQLEELEGTVKATETSRVNKEQKVIESERKVVVLEGDLARAQEKYEKFTARIKKLVAEVSDMTNDIRALEKKDQIASERDDVNEDKVKFLERQLHVTLVNAEEGERKEAKKKEEKDNAIYKIDTKKMEKKELQKSIDEIKC